MIPVVGRGALRSSSSAKWEISARLWRDVSSVENIVFSGVFSTALDAVMGSTTASKLQNSPATPASRDTLISPRIPSSLLPS